MTKSERDRSWRGTLGCVVLAAAAGCATATAPTSTATPGTAAGVCGALAGTPTGTVDDFARFSPWVTTALGGVLLDVRSGVGAEALARSLGVSSRVVACESGTQAVWLPGVEDADQAARALARRAAERGATLEVERWVGFGAASSLARVRAECRSPERCEAMARQVARAERCAIVLLHLSSDDAAPEAFARCEALPDESTACAVPALVAADPAVRASCARAVTARLR